TWVKVLWRWGEGVDPPDMEPAWFEVEVADGTQGAAFMSAGPPLVAEVAYRGSGAETVVAQTWPGPPAEFSYTLTGLSPSSGYSVRVRAVGRSGAGPYSNLLAVETQALPINSWSQIHPRSLLLARGGGGLSGPVLGRPHLSDIAQALDSDTSKGDGGYSDPPTEEKQTLPDPREGHSLAAIGEKVYMFGGRSDGHLCTALTGAGTLGDLPATESGDVCVNNYGYSSELWEFSPLSEVWEEKILDDELVGPSPREGHSASVLDGSRMFIFGGRGNGSLGSPSAIHHADLWEIELDPAWKASAYFNSTGGGSKDIPEGEQAFSAVFINDSAPWEDPSFSPMSLASAPSPNNTCVSALSVRLHVEHPCPAQLRLTLYGPGPPFVRRSHNFPPNSLGEPLLLFDGTRSPLIDTCQAGRSDGLIEGVGSSGGGLGPDLVLSDLAPLGLWDRYLQGGGGEDGGVDSNPPGLELSGEGWFKPEEKLLPKFGGAAAGGEWVLGFRDMEADGKNGTLLDWSIDFELRPCRKAGTLRWINRTSPSSLSPPPRANHAAVAFEGNLYISGGRGPSSSSLWDLWRWEGNDTYGSHWTLLGEGPTVPLPPPGPRLHESSGVLSPWGLLAFGGTY
ncbi:unnamed protein product, partial [Discosporangium mesarthrocarpum]